MTHEPTPQTPLPTDTADSAQPTPSGPGAGQASLHLQAGAKPLPEYELVRKLGEGGFGQVWLARGPGGFEVALKFIRLGEAASGTEMKALAIMKGIHHPHLLALYGVWEREGWLIVAMELADQSLADRLKEAIRQGQAGIPAAELLEYLREAAKGLDFLTHKGILHRDVKPHNLFLSGGSVKVADYGLAKVLEQTMASVSTKMTPAYASPEILDGKASKWSDQYSLAVSYCHLRGNRLPFTGSLLEMVTAHVTKPPDLSMLPPEERPVVARALAKNPAARWPNCKAFAEALALTGAGHPFPAAPRPLADDSLASLEMTRPPPLPSRRSRLGWAVAAVFLLSGGAAAMLLILRVGGNGPAAQTQAAGTRVAAATDAKDTPPLVEPSPRPELALDPLPPLTLRHGEQKTVTIRIQRRHFIGPVDLKFAGLPVDITRPPTVIPAGQDEIAWHISAGKDATEGHHMIRLCAIAKDVEQQGELRLRIERPAVVEKVGATFTNSIGMAFTYIPAGEFLMGTSGDADEHQHPVRLTKPYYLGVHEVTQGQHERVMGMNPAHFKGANLPVEQVSWEDAQEFLRKLNEKEKGTGRIYRLPTEAEWEYACRAGTQTPFHYGDSLATTQANFNGSPAYNDPAVGENRQQTTQVGTFPSNAWGLYDMHGNVYEWCQDYDGLGSYQKGIGTAIDPVNENVSPNRVWRGGSWSHNAWCARSAARSRAESGYRSSIAGFRVAVTVATRTP